MSSLLILLKFYILLLIKIKKNIISIIQSAPSLRSTPPPPSFQFFFATSIPTLFKHQQQSYPQLIARSISCSSSSAGQDWMSTFSVRFTLQWPPCPCGRSRLQRWYDVPWRPHPRACVMDYIPGRSYLLPRENHSRKKTIWEEMRLGWSALRDVFPLFGVPVYHQSPFWREQKTHPRKAFC
jgi:hypothetical protein